MDEIARSGIAAHYLYATSKSAKLVTDKEKKLIDHLWEIAESIPKNPYIYCLSPSGDILRLSRGSTIEDFAYKVHSHLPRKAKYALVNNRKKPIRRKLMSNICESKTLWTFKNYWKKTSWYSIEWFPASWK